MSESTSRGLLTKAHIRAGAIALGGMIVGALVGIAVQLGVESTGALGPSVTELMAEQEANFGDVNARLESLRSNATDPAVVAGLNELQSLLEKQQSLQGDLNGEIGYLNAQMESLRSDALAASGFAGGAGLWLDAGESVNIGDTSHVFGVRRVNRGNVDVALNDEVTRLYVGDSVSASTSAGDCQVFFRQATRRDDGRIGFDVVCG